MFLLEPGMGLEMASRSPHTKMLPFCLALIQTSVTQVQHIKWKAVKNTL